MKAFRKRLGRHKGKKDDAASEEANESGAENDNVSQQGEGGTTPVQNASLNPALLTGSQRAPSPSAVPGVSPTPITSLPPGAVLSKLPPGVTPMKMPPGGLPPGAVLVKGPPGSRPSSPSLLPATNPGSGSVSPVKMMMTPPPGAKMISGPPPEGAKLMMGPPSPGAQKMMVKSVALPPGAKIITGPPPPGVVTKMMAPPGGVPMKLMSRPLTPSEVAQLSSRPGTPEAIKSPPPPPTRLPPGARLVSSPGSSPQQNALLPSALPTGGPPPGSPPRPRSPSRLSLEGSGLQFSTSTPPAASQPLVRPQPVRVSTTQAKEALQVPTPPVSPREHDVDDGDSDGPAFVVEDTPAPKQKPAAAVAKPSSTASQVRKISLSGSDSPDSADSFFQDEGDVTTALPHAQPSSKGTAGGAAPATGATDVGGGGGAAARSINSLQSSIVVTTVKENRHQPSSSSKKQRAEDADGDDDDDRKKDKKGSRKDKQLADEGDNDGGGGKKKKKDRDSKRKSTREDKKSKKKRRDNDKDNDDDDDSASSADQSSDDGESERRHRRRHRHRSGTSTSRQRHSSRSPKASGGEKDQSRRRRTASSGSTDDGKVNDDRHARSGGSFRGGDSASVSANDNGDIGELNAAFEGRPLVPMALTPALRTRIAENFISILCPQQYFGKVKKINNIRPLQADRSRAVGLKKNNSIYVATKGALPNSIFFPQLRLTEADGIPSPSDNCTMDTPLVLYEAAPGNMLFADTELEARRLLESNPRAASCYVTAHSAIVFRNPEESVVPVAQLNVRWVPYSSSRSEPQCPIHKKELQLFDPYSKQLVCALCASKNEAQSKLVVIPDVLTGDSRRTIQESIARQLDDTVRSEQMWVGQHQRIAQMAEAKKQAVSQQFDLLLAAIEAKRNEYMESCDAEFGYALSEVAKEVLMTDEKKQLLSAATQHLRTDASKTLYSMQIATIAEGLEAQSSFPSKFSRGSLDIPTSNTIMPNLERVMAEVQALNPNQRTSRGASTPRGFGNRRLTDGRATVTMQNSSGLEGPEDEYDLNGCSKLGTPRRGSSAAPRRETRTSPGRRTARSASPQQRRRLQEEQRAITTVATTPAAADSAAGPRDYMDAVSPYSKGSSRQPRSSANGAAVSAGAYDVNDLAVPNSSGTALYDFPLHEMLTDDAGFSTVGPGRCLEWTLRVEDPGDWVGIGVGVGSSIEAWECGRANDLSHLWIVPGNVSRRVYVLRVTVNEVVNHAKLTIHDSRGKQLDDGTIPQWNAKRMCYPQATFGGRIGQVRIVEAPHYTATTLL